MPAFTCDVLMASVAVMTKEERMALQAELDMCDMSEQPSKPLPPHERRMMLLLQPPSWSAWGRVLLVILVKKFN